VAGRVLTTVGLIVVFVSVLGAAWAALRITRALDIDDSVGVIVLFFVFSVVPVWILYQLVKMI
jgi:hypothetical protein